MLQSQAERIENDDLLFCHEYDGLEEDEDFLEEYDEDEDLYEEDEGEDFDGTYNDEI